MKEIFKLVGKIVLYSGIVVLIGFVFFVLVSFKLY